MSSRLSLCFLLLFSLDAMAEPYWEHSPHQDHGLSYDGYLGSLGIPAAHKRSRCKDDHCRHFITLGEQEFTVAQDDSIVLQSRYRSVTYALMQKKDQLMLLSSQSRTQHAIDDLRLSQCLSMNGGIIRADGTPLCVSGQQLLTGSDEPLTLSGKNDWYRFATSFDGGWALARIDEQQQVFVLHGTATGTAAEQQIATGLHQRSDTEHTLALFPTQDGVWLAVYEYYNKRNKSLMLYQLQDGQTAAYTVSNSIADDSGVMPELYQTRDGELRLSSAPLHGDIYYRIDPASLPGQQPAFNPYTSTDLAELQFSLGLRLTQWSVNQSVKEPSNSDGNTNKLASVDYNMNDSLLTEYRLAGRIMGNQVALSYLKSETQRDMGSLEKAASQKLYGTIGFDRFFTGPSTLRLEYASELAGGIATYTDNANNREKVDFKNDYRRYSLLKTSELGRFAGISYARNNLPMAIGFFESGLTDPLIYFDPDFSLQKLSFVFGFDTAQYASRYLFNYRDVYFDGRGGIGLYQYHISRSVLRQAEADSGKHHKSNVGLAVDASLEGGYLWQLRSVANGGLGISLQTGLSIDFEMYLNGISEDTEVDDDEIVSSFERTDIRWGPFLRLNMLY